MRCLIPAVFALLCMYSSWKSAACSGVTIIKGKEVKPHSRPWMVSIQVNGYHTCGGILIKDQWVVTAAHCKKNFRGSLKSVTAVLGAHALSEKEGKGVCRVGIEVCHTLPTYSEKSKAGDIMLLKLRQKIKLKTAKVHDLPRSSKDIPAGTACKVTGWGVTSSESKNPSDTLQEADVYVVDRELCNCLHNNNPAILESMLCARNIRTGADSCLGDSGGPLICKNNLVGMISGGGLPCGNPKKPGVYTRFTSEILSWISNVIKKGSNSTTGTGGETWGPSCS
ncbi:granzyme K-like [Scleropages formosus]|uniref:Granzyme K-like n=1 Tax=Scleropages formosus TaxID=113540 RepID=A0A8C9V6S3_SCLFO|nr:granzyme K-like [Scleropages formosus]